MELRAPIRPLARTQRSAWLWSVGIVTGLLVLGAIAYLQLETRAPETNAVASETGNPALPSTVYVFRCANGNVQAEPCDAPQAPRVEADRAPLTVYRAPRLSDTPTGRRLLNDADARLRREKEVARQSRSPSPYEETVAITNSPRCRALRKEREQIRSAMRRGYDLPLGEHYRRRYYEVGQAGIAAGCWTGSVPPG